MVGSIWPDVETGALVITLRDRIDLLSVDRVRRAMARCAAHHPPFVVVDCAEASGGRRLPGMLWAAMLCWGARLPGSSFLICAPTEGAARFLRRAPASRLRLYPSLSHALADIRPHHTPARVPRAHLRLPNTPQAAHAARQLLRAFCQRWNLADAVDAGELIISELVSNAVEHAGTEVDVTISSHRRLLRVAVADRSPKLPTFGPAAGEASDSPNQPQLAIRGRGLVLVARTAHRCGVLGGAAGKLVWATVTVPRRRPRLPQLEPARRLRRAVAIRRWLPARAT